MNREKRAGLVLCLAMAVGCSGDDAAKDIGLSPDFQVFSDLATLDQATACGPETYPCSPYGTQKNDTVKNEDFLGFRDPNNFCIAHNKKVLDKDKVVAMSFGSWFVEPTGCRGQKKKLLWVNVAAGWCEPCKAELRHVRDLIQAGNFDESVGFVNVMFEDAQHRPASVGFLKTWAAYTQLNVALVADPEFRMGQYFNKSATPFNMLVDTSNMKIVYRGVGFDPDTIELTIKDFLSQK